ncbi:HD domain-containing phosphohydrolase [Longimicrobium sp.]|uniref:HD domain-containing phosphohydrolase n=1 Tax=Longimicrobium sp. TaxID=2029185 RepID=UPI002E337578|nr:HD domain-containing phosphohydrolase [Longimicrobium sp.]HEX6041440.1 HD domain-containing phosphohydrolase [Longimicrobium sp.]
MTEHAGTGGAAGEAGMHDPVLQALQSVEEAYREQDAAWHQRQAQMAEQLATERAVAERQHRRAECLDRALREIHGALFGGDVYQLILQACLTITEASRGVYVTAQRPGDRLRVRAAIGLDGAAAREPSPFITAIARRVLDGGETLVCNPPDPQPELPAPGDGERFRNFVAAPVVLMADLDGVIIAADRRDGAFDRHDVDSLLSVGGQAAVAVRNRRLERELQHAYLATVSMLADAVEAKDPYTHGHCEMASRYARLVGERMGLPAYDQAVVCYSALLHDVGKIGVSDGVLHKPGPLLPEERDLMRAHVRVGHDLLSSVPALGPVAQVVLHHHEWYDGGGYPDGLAGEKIPLPARIVAAVDAYCAMITRRSYKEAYTEERARQELMLGAGTQFDPAVVEALLAVLDDPAGQDADDDYDAECGLLPDFLSLTTATPTLFAPG